MPPPCSSAFWKSSLKTSASAVARSPGERDRLELRLDRLAGDQALDEHRAQPLDQLGEVDVVLAVLGQHLVHRRDREDPVDRVGQRPARVDVGRARLQPQQRRHGLQVVLDPVVDLLGEHAAHHRAAVLERDGGVVGDRLEQPAVLVREGRVAVADELADLPPLPAQRQADGVRAGPPLRPGDLAVLEHERGAGRVDGGDRRLDDRLQRLLQVERLRDGLRDPRQRLELVHAPLRVGVEPRVLDRLRDLRGDRDQQVDLGLAVLARRARAHVERALELLPREDRNGEDRLVLVLGQVREELEARVEVRCAAITTGARSAAATPVIPSPGRIRGRRVISSTLVPCVARSTSSSARSS